MRGGCAVGFAAVSLLVVAKPRSLDRQLRREEPCREREAIAAAEPMAVLAAQHCGIQSWGGGRFPFATIYRHKALDQELLVYLQGAMVGWYSKGLAQRGRGGDSKIWKIDWHTIPGLPYEAPVFVPRPDKPRDVAPRAPRRIFGFVEAFRQANAEVFEGMAQDLDVIAFQVETGHWDTWQWPASSKKDTWLLRAFAELIRGRRHFGVVEAQIYHGGHTHEGGAHNDGTTSVLHLSLTLGGYRTVRSLMAPNGTDPRWHASLMEPGDLYLSSPSFFMHRVSYHPAPIEMPLVALHFRFGFPPKLAAHLNQRWDLPMLEVARVVAHRMRQCEASLRTPTLAAVRAAESHCCPDGVA
mmetsp:Transcript_59777/g.187627  ORF Transcript_59777/g.187627 Transcript_59777/m.187627 type:complete len:354 (-) Transcript_59777:55-1116(-)